MGKRKIELAMMLLVLIAAFFASKKAVSLVSSNMGEAKTVVIDVGHGGEDPGKVGIDGVLEKELNLQIAQKVRDKLENSGYRVVMTRETDVGLYEEGTSNKKAQDLQNRCKIIEEADPGTQDALLEQLEKDMKEEAEVVVVEEEDIPEDAE